jgi:hypothetical protein
LSKCGSNDVRQRAPRLKEGREAGGEVQAFRGREGFREEVGAALTAEPARAGVGVLGPDEATLGVAAAHVPQHPEQLQQHERGEEAQQVPLAHARGVHGPGQQE